MGKKIVGYFGGAVGVAVFAATFVAYFTFSFDQTGQAYDGFGRPLSESPILVRMFFGQERMWAGGLWFVADLIIFWGGLGIAFYLLSWGFGGSADTSDLDS